MNASDAMNVLMVAPFVVALVFTPVFLFKRLRYRRNRRAFAPGYGSLGNALQTLQMLTRPTIHHVLAEKLSEDAEEEADGAPPDPGNGRSAPQASGEA